MDEDGRREAKLLEQIEQLKTQLSLQMDSQEELAVTEKRYRSLVESAPFPIVVIDRDLKVLSINRLMPGYKEEDVIGKSIFEHVQAEDPELIKTTIERVFKTGEVGDYQMKGPRFDGGTGIYLTTLSPVIQDGEVVAVTSVAMEITKELEATRALKESEERYRMLAESSFEGIVIHQNGLIIDANSRVTEISGYDREELIGSKFFNLLHPSSMETVVKNIQEETGSPYGVLGIAKDGSILELEVLGKTIPYKGDIARVACVRDVSERKHQEEALRRSEERYRLVTDNLHDVIWTMDLDLKYTYISASVERQRGYTAEEVMQQTIHDVMTPESLEKVFDTVDSVLRPVLAGEADLHTSVTLDLGMYRKDGSVMPAEMSISVLLDAEERPIGIMGVTRDISDRTDAEKAVAKSDARYRMFAENADDIIFTLTPDLELDYVSPSLLKLTGYTADELVEMGWQGLFTPDSLELALETISDDALGVIEPDKAKEKSVRMELEILTKRGKKRWIEVNISLLTAETGDVTSMIGVARDVTERKRTQAQFLEEKKRAELYLDLFGHDIRNINQGIMSYLELILMRQGLNPEEVEYIKSVLEQATRINDLVAKVQRLTQIRASEIEPVDVDAQKMINGALDYVIAKYPDRTIEVNTHEGCSTHIVKGSNLLMDVFTSILDNAVRFNRNDTVEVDISCHPTEDGERIRFMFDDRGPGIPDEMKVKVFRRLDQPEGGTKGSGLGLTVVGEIVKQVGGKVWVEDRVAGDPKEGSRFVVELPVGGDAVE